MSIHVRRSKDIYHANGGFFTGDWHFSFDEYYDPENTRFGSLRVFNVDTIVPGGVWPLHPHTKNEVVTYCAHGEFRHGDNLGNAGVLYPGDVQHTTVGTGLWHTEVNNRNDMPMTFIQVWIMPWKADLAPSVEQRRVEHGERLNRFLLLASGDAARSELARTSGSGGSAFGPDDGQASSTPADSKVLPIQQDAQIYSATVEAGHQVRLALDPGFGAYFYCISGRVRIAGERDSRIGAPEFLGGEREPSPLRTGGHQLEGRDAAKVLNEESLTVDGLETAELFLVVVRV